MKTWVLKAIFSFDEWFIALNGAHMFSLCLRVPIWFTLFQVKKRTTVELNGYWYVFLMGTCSSQYSHTKGCKLFLCSVTCRFCSHILSLIASILRSALYEQCLCVGVAKLAQAFVGWAMNVGLWLYWCVGYSKGQLSVLVISVPFTFAEIGWSFDS